MSLQDKRPDVLADAAPPRLLEDPASSALVRQDLANAAGAAPSYDVATGLLALQAALGTTAKIATAGSAGTSAAASTAPTAATGGLALKLAIIGGLSAIAIGGAGLLSSSSSHGGPQPAPRAPAVQQHAPALNEAPAVREPQPQSQPQPQPQPQPQLALQKSHQVPVVSNQRRDPAAEEIAQLAQISALVKGAPARALRLAEQGHRRFGEGYLHHEREGLAIIALHGLGRHDEAQARAQRYLARYPHSSLSERVRALETGVPKP